MSRKYHDVFDPEWRRGYTFGINAGREVRDRHGELLYRQNLRRLELDIHKPFDAGYADGYRKAAQPAPCTDPEYHAAELCWCFPAES